jgi:Fe(3+) dicitrate transport protein
MKFRTHYLTLLLVLFSQLLQAQLTISGTVISEETQLAIPKTEVFNTATAKSVLTNDLGVFEFKNVEAGTCTLVIFSPEYEVVEISKEISENTNFKFVLPALRETLNEVLVTKRKEKIFALKKLRDVEGTAIYAGKKSEVVVLDNLTANLASNNARQIYAQVVGLNIYDNDDAGLQLSIGGRGLDPNRTANFNTRQNGYDISADVLGYPESYYTPPAEAIEQIEVVRGAASLQYGTQFGGLLNFKLRQPDKTTALSWVSRQSIGSNDLFTSFNSLSGTSNKLGYYTYFNYKTGTNFRPNSQFESYNGHVHVEYAFTSRTKLTFEFSLLDYLAQQPGGLTDSQFEKDPTFSNRTRNWFDVDWNLYSMRLDHNISEKTDLSLTIFGLDASRKSVGFRENRVSQVDDLEAPRELIVGNYLNWGAEGRLLTRFNLFQKKQTLLVGAKYYQSKNTERQGPGTAAADANFNFADVEYPNYARQSDFTFPNLNVALFGENIFKVSEKLSVTPGFRMEYIKTESQGEYKNILFDLAGNPILNETLPDNRDFERNFVLFGVGLGYNVSDSSELYANVSQNYRSVTFNDIRITNPSLTIDPNITDEQGYTIDMGLRGRFKKYLSFDVGAFLLSYQDRIGVVLRAVSDIEEERFRGNIGDALTYGLESFVDWNIWETFSENENFRLNTFVNFALTESEYTRSGENNVEGKQVEFIPEINLKTGLSFGYKDILTSIQYTYLSKQFTDATNSPRDLTSQSGIIGEIPSYDILDVSLSYTYKWFKVESGINNLFDNSYFTRRATGYPGPGIIPSQPRTFYALFQFKL